MSKISRRQFLGGRLGLIPNRNSENEAEERGPRGDSTSYSPLMRELQITFFSTVTHVI